MAAAYGIGHRYNASELARLMGRKPGEFCKKLNPDCDDRHITLAEAVAITELTGDNAILEAWSASRGKVLVELPAGVVSDDDLVEQVLLAQAVFGSLMQAIHDARADGIIDRMEHGQIARIGTQVAEHVLGLISTTAVNVRQLPASASK
ncbi:phage regulatory CII family protein [Aeromonas veronii]|uniref:phage regulatory CII family protein n=1 Tax=Aeromonas veronii TaxID=654 RepID=UPI0029D6F3E9|nr:phage regulatory CII family protein [Aeromonas veronii]MDX7877649.1 phage regulatory CII family protein [Aeromonas veronii]